MLSILIPTYNYPALELVTEIQKQCENTGIIYEIIVSDDGSSEEITLETNRKINHLSNSRFEENTKNIGRAANRNLLTQKAQYQWLLFMDSDTLPKKKDFIDNYLAEIRKNNGKICFGGICYKETRPDKKHLLRWKYGRKREELNKDFRIKNSYESTLISNIILHKSVFAEVLFNQNIIEYGYEDFLFVSEIKKLGITINHIDNPAYHLNYETSEIFLLKTEKSLINLKWIHENGLINNSQSKLIQKWIWLNKYFLKNCFLFFFSKLTPIAKKNLLSKNPSLFVFDLYKLGYFCSINTK